jgi:GT2 family glycosyltransferase
MQSKISVVVLCYNGVELTLGCLESILKQDYGNVEVVLVDNGSTDGTVALVTEKFPQARWVENHKNLGYAMGNNKGIEYALASEAGAVFLVNNDTRLHETCISSLVKSLNADPKIGVIGPMVYTWDGNKTISSAGGMVNWRMAYAVNEGMGEKDAGQYRGRYVDFINGCGILVTREAINRTGGLDPTFFMYWEETDWCLRVKKSGLEVYFEPTGEMEHKAPIVSTELGPTTLYYITRNRFLFFFRHSPGSIKPISLARALKGTLRGIHENRKANKAAHAKAMQCALLHAVSGRWGYVDPKIWAAG